MPPRTATEHAPDWDPGVTIYRHTRPNRAPSATPTFRRRKSERVRCDDGRAFLALMAMIGLYVAGFGYLTYRNHALYTSFGFDLGIHDQAIWLAAHGRSMFDTVRGLHYFAENVNLVSLGFVPFYWLGAGASFLIVANTLALGLGALPLWLIGKRRLNSPVLALLPAAAYLLYPALGYMNWWSFHPESFAIVPLLFAWLFAIEGRWLWFAACVAIAMSSKEDATVAVAAMGVAIALWPGFFEHPGGASSDVPLLKNVSLGPREGLLPEVVGALANVSVWGWSLLRSRRGVGAMTTFVAVAWFEYCSHVILPGNNFGAPPFYSSYFGSLGTSPTEIIANAMRHPRRVSALATLPDRKTYYVQMFAPVGFLFLLAGPALLVGLPQLAINVLATGEQGATIQSQYATFVTVGVFLATVEALGMIHRRLPGLVHAACALLIFTTAASAAAWGISPIGVNFHKMWRSGNPKEHQLNQALRLVPPTAGLAVSYNLTPHVTHRLDVYEFPNPWINVNWLSTRVPERPSTVQWIVVELDQIRSRDQALLTQLTKPLGPFIIVYKSNGVVAAERR